jgi:hypothetical protein
VPQEEAAPAVKSEDVKVKRPKRSEVCGRLESRLHVPQSLDLDENHQDEADTKASSGKFEPKNWMQIWENIKVCCPGSRPSSR